MSSQSPQPSPDSPAAELAATIERRRRDVQFILLFAVIVITAINVLAISLLFPAAGENEFFTYDSVVPSREFHWPFLTLAGANIVAAAMAGVIATLSLVPRRGWPWATAGAALGVVGAGFYAVGVGGWAMVYFFAADSTALDPATASAFVDSVNADAYRLFAAAFTGAILIAIATMVMAVGLWRSGNLPKWIIALGVVGSIITFFLPTTGVVGALVESPQAAAGVLTGWYAWRLRHALRG